MHRFSFRCTQCVTFKPDKMVKQVLRLNSLLVSLLVLVPALVLVPTLVHLIVHLR